jgi:hypothetical protein
LTEETAISIPANKYQGFLAFRPIANRASGNNYREWKFDPGNPVFHWRLAAGTSRIGSHGRLVLPQASFLWGIMIRNNVTRIGALALAALFAFSMPIAAAEIQPDTQGLWVGGYSYFSEFQGQALQQSGTPDANLTFGSQIYFAPISIAFDGHQNLWATFQGIDDNFPAAILEIGRRDMARLKRGKHVTPRVIVIKTFPGGLAFDSSGDLWITTEFFVAGKAQGEIVELRRQQIGTSGKRKPSISVTSPNFYPGLIRFDASDNLWVTQFLLASNSIQILRFAPSDRAASGPANPSLIVNLPDLNFAVDFAFDAVGNLWVAGAGSHGDEVEMIPASDLMGTAEVSPTAAVTITSSAFGLGDSSGSCLSGIDFDQSANLWVSVGANNGACGVPPQLVEFTPAQLSTGGNLTPLVIISQNSTKTNLFISGPMRFGPTVN